MTQREIEREAKEYGGGAAVALPLLFLLACIAVVAMWAVPAPAAQRGYTFENVDRLAGALAEVIKARWGCPAEWDYRTHTWDDCRPAAAHRDLEAYERARRAARKLFPAEACPAGRARGGF